MLYLIGIIISFFLFLLLVIKKEKSVADKILMVWMLVLAIHQFLFYLDFSKISHTYPHLLGLSLAFPVSHGVLLFFYAATLTGQKAITVRSGFLHFIPFLLLVLLAMPFYALSGNEKLAIFQNEGAGYEWYGIVQILLTLVSGLGYVAWSLLMIQKSRVRMENIFSNTDRKNMQWLEYLSVGLAGVWLLVFFFDDHIIFSGVAVLVLLIGIFGINQLQIFAASPEIILPDATPQTEQTENTATRYAKSGLKAEDGDLLFYRLDMLMKNEALYKKNDLSLTELATQLEVHPNYLSQVINEKTGKNFYTYINTLRAEAFVRLVALPEKRHFTLLALGYECGFNSKSTFNKYVKLVSGKIPSAYI